MALCLGSRFLSLLLLSKLLCMVTANLPELLLCADARCFEKIAEGVTVQRFHAPDKSRVSFLTNEKVTIYAKSNDKRHQISFIEVNGRKGFAPTGMIKEEHTFRETGKLVTVKVDDVHRSDTDNVSRHSQATQASKAPSGVVQGTSINVLPQHSSETEVLATPSFPEESSVAPTLVPDNTVLLKTTPEVQPSLSGDASLSAAGQTPSSTLAAERSCTLDGTPMFGDHCENEGSDVAPTETIGMYNHPPQSFKSGLPLTTMPTPNEMKAKWHVDSAEHRSPIAVSDVQTVEKSSSSPDKVQVNKSEGAVQHAHKVDTSETETNEAHLGMETNTSVDGVPNLLGSTNEKVADSSEAAEQKDESPPNVEEAPFASDMLGDLKNDTAENAIESKPPDKNLGEPAPSADADVSKEIKNIPGEDDDDGEDDVEDEAEGEDLDEADRNGIAGEDTVPELNQDAGSIISQKRERSRETAGNIDTASVHVVGDVPAAEKSTMSEKGNGSNENVTVASPPQVELVGLVDKELGNKASETSVDNSHMIASSLLVTTADALGAVASQTEKGFSEATSTGIPQHLEGSLSSQETSGASERDISQVLFPSAAETFDLESHLETPLLSTGFDASKHAEGTSSFSVIMTSTTADSDTETVAGSLQDMYLSTDRPNNEESDDDSGIKSTYERRSLFSFLAPEGGSLDTPVQSPVTASTSGSIDAATVHPHASNPLDEELATDSKENVVPVLPITSSSEADGLLVTSSSLEQDVSSVRAAHSGREGLPLAAKIPDTTDGKLATGVSTADVTPEQEVPSVTEESTYVAREVSSQSDSSIDSSLIADDAPQEDPVDYLQMYLTLLKDYTQFIVDLLPEPLHSALLDQQVRGLSPRVTVFTFLSGLFSVVLVISFGCIVNNKRSRSLMVSIASLEKNLFNTRTERDVLKEEVEQFKIQVSSTYKASQEKQDQVRQLQKANKELEINNQQLEAALQKVKDAWNQDRNQLGSLSSDLNQKENEVAELQCAIEKQREENQSMARQLQQCENMLEEERARSDELRSSEQQLQSKTVDMKMMEEKLLQETNVLNERVEMLSSKVEADAEEIEKLLRSLRDRDAENQVLQESIKNLTVLQDMCNSTGDESQDAGSSKEVEACLNRLMDVGQMRLEYQKIKEQNDLLEEQITAERRHLEKKKDQVDSLENDMEKLKRETREAQRERTEAVTKLEILSAYFKDREVQLQKEIGKQEVLRNQKDADATTAEQQLSLLEQQNASYKSQLTSLKQEMEISERNYKNQITDQEKRAHENWLAARAAERKLEEANKELASIRQRLTLSQREKEQYIQAALTNSHCAKPLPSGDPPVGAPPLPPLPPPPPPMFLPPPPFMGEPFPPHPPEPWMLHGGLPPPPPPEVFKRLHRGSPGSFARASPGSSLRDDSPPCSRDSRCSPPMRLPHFYDSRGGHSPPPLGLLHGPPGHGPSFPPPMTLGFRGPRGLHRSSNSLSDGKSSAHSTSRPSPQPSPTVQKSNGPATGV